MSKYDVFVSYSSKDKAVADALVAGLERSEIRCWYAPRDIPAGSTYATSIVEAIRESRIMVLIFSDSANKSGHVKKEVERAVHHELHIIPFRIQSVQPSGDMEYFVSNTHWLDALPKPTKKHLKELVEIVSEVLSRTPPRPPLQIPFGKIFFGFAVAAVLFLAWIGRGRIGQAIAWLGQDDAAEVTEEDDAPSDTIDETDVSSQEPAKRPSDPPMEQERSSSELASPEPTDTRNRNLRSQQEPTAATRPQSMEARARADQDNARSIESDEEQKSSSIPRPHENSETEATEDTKPAIPPRPSVVENTVRDIPAQETLDSPPSSVPAFEGTIGGQSGNRAVHELTIPEHGCLQIAVANLAQPGGRSQITRVRVDGQDLPHPPRPGDEATSGTLTVVEGETIEVIVEVQQGHVADYRVRPLFKSLGNLGLAVSDQFGVFNGRVDGTVGFGQPSYDEWEYVVNEAGRLRFSVRNEMPAGTSSADVKQATFNTNPLPHPPRPNEENATPFVAVSKGYRVNVIVEAKGGHNVNYSLVPELETLTELGMQVSDEYGDLMTATRGTLGFGQPSVDTWTYVAKDHGRLRFTVANEMPSGTNNANVQRARFDGYELTHPPRPSESNSTPFVTVNKDQKINIEIAAAAGDSLNYRLEPEFESVSDMGLTRSDASGEFSKPVQGTVGFGQRNTDAWTYVAGEDGRLQFFIENKIPSGTFQAQVKAVTFDGVPVPHPPRPGEDYKTPFVNVRKGQKIKVQVAAVPGDNLIYLLTPNFEPL